MKHNEQQAKAAGLVQHYEYHRADEPHDSGFCGRVSWGRFVELEAERIGKIEGRRVMVVEKARGIGLWVNDVGRRGK